MSEKVNEEHLKKLEVMQGLVLDVYTERLQQRIISDTGLANLTKFLRDNGWSLDPAKVPPELKQMLTEKVDPASFDDEDIAGHIGAA